MGIFDKARDLARGNRDKADQIIDRAGDMIDQRTGGKHAEHVDKAQDFARGQYGGGEQPPAPERQQAPPASDAQQPTIPEGQQPPPPEGHIGEERPPA